MQPSQPDKSFPIRSSVRLMWASLAFLGFAMVVSGLATGKPLPGGSVAMTAGIVMAIWSLRASIVRLFDDHFEIKIAPLAARRRVRYSDIDRVEVVSRKAARLTLRGAGKQRPITIPLSMLTEDDGARLVEFLSAKAAA